MTDALWSSPPCRDPRGHVMSDTNVFCVLCGWVRRAMPQQPKYDLLGSKRAKARKIRPTLGRIERLAERDGGMFCFYCSIEIKKGFSLTLDHVVPQSKGGLHDDNNLVLSCFPCNHAKDETDADVFRRSEWLESRQRFVGRLRWLGMRTEVPT